MGRLRTLLSNLRDKPIFKVIPVAVIAGVVAVAYAAGAVIEAGIGTYLASLPALAVLALTSLARVNDIGEDKTDWHWQLRRIGLTLVGVAAVVLACTPLVHTEAYPTWKGLAMYYGFALTWITTPNMPPWWRYVSGEAKAKQTGD